MLYEVITVSFVGELSRRNVIRVGIAYALIAWLIIQVADIVLETIGAPGWVMQTLMLVLLLGFLVTAIFAWAYEVNQNSRLARAAIIGEGNTAANQMFAPLMGENPSRNNFV